MQLLKRLWIAAGLSIGIALFATDVSAAPTAGKDYTVLPLQHNVEPGNKVEVVEFFWYSCPHCSALEPSIEAWATKNASRVNFIRVPIRFDARFEPEQRLYYTLKALNRLDLHAKVFSSIHVDRKMLNTEDKILAFAKEQGMDPVKFKEMYESFGVQSEANGAAKKQEEYKIDGVPTLAVDGRFITSPAQVGQAMGGNQPEAILFPNTLKVLDFLVARTLAENGAKAALPKK